MPYDNKDGDKKGRKDFAVMIASGLPKGMGKKKPDPMAEEDGEDDGAARAAAGEDLAAAIQGGDGAAIADAFAALRDLT